MQNRTIEFKFRLNRSEADVFNKRVKKSGLSREGYIRQLINGLVPTDAPPPDYFAMMRELHYIDYAAQVRKTRLSDERTEIMRHFVTGVNCQPDTARDEMMATKKKYGKNEGIVAFHGYQSFAPGEVTPEGV